MKRGLLVILLSALLLPASAQPIQWGHSTRIPVDTALAKNARWFQGHFAELMQRWGVPGGTVAIMKNGKLLYAAGFGYGNIANKQPVTPNSLFRVASISKVVTAVAVLKLVQDGKLHLDDKVFSILNDVKPLPGMRVNREVYDITVRDLLAMSSGWAHYAGGTDPMFGPWSNGMEAKLGNVPASCLQTTRYMMAMPLQFQPGTSYSYMNLNYCILGLIVSKVSGNNYSAQTYQNYVQKQILAPIGINDMQIGHSTREGRIPGEVTYYPYSDQSFSSGLPYTNSPIIENNAADGGWLASSIDLVKFLSAVSSGKVINPMLIRQMTARQIPNQKRSSKYQGLGWRLIKKGSQLTWYKTGSFPGTNGLIVRRADGTVIAAVFNTMPGDLARFRVQLMSLMLSKNLLK